MLILILRMDLSRCIVLYKCTYYYYLLFLLMNTSTVINKYHHNRRHHHHDNYGSRLVVIDKCLRVFLRSLHMLHRPSLAHL